MSADFEWITGDDGHWPVPPPEPAPKPTSRRWLLLALVVLLVAGGGGHWQVRQRVAAATTAVTEEVRATYHLYVRAAANHDTELLRSVISGSHTPWVAAQLALLDEGLLLGRWSMGLHLASDTAVPNTVRITPMPNLTEAEVVAQQTFTFVHADGRQEQATLEHTLLFRHGRDRWLAVRPEADFWGEWRLKDGQQITLIYPQRDAQIADHVLLGLEAELARACRRLQLPCSPDDSYTIRLDTNPASLAAVGSLDTMLTGQTILNLPAPSLVGRPVDITGERALLRGYKAHFITAVIVHHTGWHCCEQGLFHQALIDLQLRQLDLRPWPLQMQHYQEMVRNPIVGVYSLGRYWHEPPTPAAQGFAWAQVYTMLDVLLQEKPELTPFALQRSLVVKDSYRDWINKHVGFALFNQGRFQRAWLNAVQAHLPPVPAGLPPPTQDVLLLCRTRTQSAPDLYRYTWASQTWTLVLANRRLQFLAGLPGDEGVLLQEQPIQGQPLHTFAWVNGREQTITYHPSLSALFRTDVVGAEMLLYVFKFDENHPVFDLVDLADCGPTACPVAEFRHVPIQSPDGRWLLSADDKERLWLRRAADVNVGLLWHGRAPFWLVDDVYGYVTEESMAINTLPGHVNIQTYPLDTVAAAIQVGHNVQDWRIHALVANPQNQHEVFMAGTYTAVVEGDRVKGTVVLRFDLAQGTATVLFEAAGYFGPYNPFLFSPDGQWLTVQSYVDEVFDWQLDILNLQSDQHVTYRSGHNVALPGYDWSADGRWLLRVDSDFIHLSAPKFGYDQVVIYDFANCNFAAWVS